MTIAEAKIGMRAKFVGNDRAFHGKREGHCGKIIADATLNPAGHEWGSGTCVWQLDGDRAGYITGLEDLEKLD